MPLAFTMIFFLPRIEYQAKSPQLIDSPFLEVSHKLAGHSQKVSHATQTGPARASSATLQVHLQGHLPRFHDGRLLIGSRRDIALGRLLVEELWMGSLQCQRTKAGEMPLDQGRGRGNGTLLVSLMAMPMNWPWLLLPPPDCPPANIFSACMAAAEPIWPEVAWLLSSLPPPPKNFL